MLSIRLCLFFLPVLATAPVMAAETTSAQPPYLDDRSTPDGLIRSLYNAVNRREFARAWSYFSKPPSKDFDTFAAGFAKTGLVDVATGLPFAEGAAGSTFYTLPVGIRATDAEGEETAYGGCYTIRAVNAQIQDPPFRPLTIEKGVLKPAEAAGFPYGVLPENCDGAQAEPETEEELRLRVIDLFRREHHADCEKAVADQRPFLSGEEPQIHELRYRYDYETADDAEHVVRLYRFACALYAYNASEAYYLADQDGAIEAVSFSEPDLDIAYADEANTSVKSLAIAGYSATHLLINSEFDPQSKTVTSFSKWRGFGDAFSAGTWTFRNGRFVLTAYAVDPTYDEQENPQDLVKFPAIP